MRLTLLAAFLATLLIGLTGCGSTAPSSPTDGGDAPVSGVEAAVEKSAPAATKYEVLPYESQTAPTRFSSQVNWLLKAENLLPHGINPYYPPLIPGHSFVMEEPNFSDEGDEGHYRKEVVVLDEVEEFDVPSMGGKFQCGIVEEKEFLDGKQFSRSLNWYCIDKTTSTIYTMGEMAWETLNERGDMSDTVSETWRVGENDSNGRIEAGLIFPGTVITGGRWIIDGAEGQAFVGGEVAETGITIETPAGTFTNCVRTREYDILDPADITDKIWAPGVGIVSDTSDGLLIESDVFESGKAPDAPAVAETEPATDPEPEPAADPGDRISEEKAREIALKAVPGEITEIGIERKLGDLRYVVEVVAEDGGVETDVVIDLKTGEVVGTEK